MWTHLEFAVGSVARVTYRTVMVPLVHWRMILVCAEGTMKGAAEDCDVVSYGSGAVVYDAGSRAISDYSGPLTRLGWPPDEHILAITLEEDEWAWILQQLNRWGAYDGFDVDSARRFLNDELGDSGA